MCNSSFAFDIPSKDPMITRGQIGGTCTHKTVGFIGISEIWITECWCYVFHYSFSFSTLIDGDLSIGISFHTWSSVEVTLVISYMWPQYPIYEYLLLKRRTILLKYFLFRCTYFIWSISCASRLLRKSFMEDPFI